MQRCNTWTVCLILSSQSKLHHVSRNTHLDCVLLPADITTWGFWCCSCTTSTTSSWSSPSSTFTWSPEEAAITWSTTCCPTWAPLALVSPGKLRYLTRFLFVLPRLVAVMVNCFITPPFCFAVCYLWRYQRSCFSFGSVLFLPHLCQVLVPPLLVPS